MGDKIRFWFYSNQLQITWFIIGMLSFDGLYRLGVHDYTGALLSFGLAYLNYILNKR